MGGGLGMGRILDKNRRKIKAGKNAVTGALKKHLSHLTLSRRKGAQTIALGAALLIGVILLVAALGKLLYPAESLKSFERLIGVVEILLVAIIFAFRRHWQVWLGAALMFAAWGGYALFWYGLKLPCHCMGMMFSIPSFFLIALDVLLFIISMVVGYLLGAKRQHLFLTLLLGVLLGFAGFAFAQWVYLEM